MKDSLDFPYSSMNEMRQKCAWYNKNEKNLQHPLRLTFAAQNDLLSKVSERYNDFFGKPVHERMVGFAQALIQESAEIMDRLPFKHWKTYTPEQVEEMLSDIKLAEEIIDAFHFIMDLWITLGYNHDDFFAMYMVKNKINRERQNRGY